MFPNHINSPFRTPPNSVEQSLNISLSTPPNIRRLGFFNAVSSALAHQFLNQSDSSSSSFISVESPAIYSLLSVNSLDSCSTTHSPVDQGESTVIDSRRTPGAPSRLIEPGRVFLPMSEGEQRSQLRAELLTWVSGAGGAIEAAERRDTAIRIISCFHNKWTTLAINSPSITNLPTCIGFLGHLKTLDLSNCGSLASLPNVMDHFTSLHQLNLSNCQSLAALPPTINALPGKSSLFLTGSGVDITNPLLSRLPGLQP